MNKGLIAIGGGNLQRQETINIDKKIISLTEKQCPKVLFFPTAMHDDQGYAKRFKQYYRSLGCEVKAIRLFHTYMTKEEIFQEMKNSDIIYIGGGDTALLIETFRNWEMEKLLKECYENGIIIAGYSAGANILFTYGYSEYKQGFTFLKGFELAQGVYTPHAQLRPQFFDVSLDKTLEKIACADGCAYMLYNGQGAYIK